MEAWKDVPAYEGLYSASNFGRVRINVDRHNIRAGAMLALWPGEDGYLRTSLRRGEEKRSKHFMVSRVILAAFDREPLPKEEANHKNGVITDNRLENLEWLTQTANIMHSIEVLGSTRKGAKNPCARLTDLQVVELRERAVHGETFLALGKAFGVSNVMARQIATGRSWSHVGGPRIEARPQAGRPRRV